MKFNTFFGSFVTREAATTKVLSGQTGIGAWKVGYE
jgi:hypothetical protein